MNNRQNSTNINWYPGHMAKTRREICEKLKLIDIVYEVIDARMPASSKIEDLDELVKDKPRIIIMTKWDLCDEKETKKYIEMYQKEGYPVVAVDLMKGKNIDEILDISKKILKENNQKRQEKGLKERSIRALIIGAPNVGKSTLINRLVGKKSAGVGNRPGFTKNLSWIRIHKEIELLDSPGILWPKIKDQEQAHILAAFSSIKEEIVDPMDLSQFILRKLASLYSEKLQERYGFSSLSDDLIEEYNSIAKKRGLLQKGGITDYEKTANIIINDLKNGYFGKVTFDRQKK